MKIINSFLLPVIINISFVAKTINIHNIYFQPFRKITFISIKHGKIS